VISSDGTAQLGYSATSNTQDAGLLTCSFSVPSDGTYRIWVHVAASSPSADSFYVDIDGDNTSISLTPTPTPPAAIFDTQEQSQPCSGAQSCTYGSLGWTGAFVWNPLNARNASCGSCTGNYTEKDAFLTVAGNPHTLKLRNRETSGGVSAKLDYFIVTQNFSFDPYVTPVPTQTPVGGVCHRWVRCNHREGWVNVPCNLPPGRVIPCPFKN